MLGGGRRGSARTRDERGCLGVHAGASARVECAGSIGHGHTSPAPRRASHHAVGHVQQRRPVRDEDHGAPRREALHCFEHLLLGLSVEVGGRLVEQQQRRVAQERAGQRDALALAGRQPGAALAEDGVQAVRQAGHDIAQAGGGTAAASSSSEASRRPSRTFSAIERREQVRSLRHPGKLRAPRVGVELGEVDTADAHRSALGRDEAEQHAQQRRLATAAGAGKRHDFACLDISERSSSAGS